jgi:glyoxylate reductase
MLNSLRKLMDSRDRSEFLKGLSAGGKYAGIIGVYRHNTSADHIGVFDKEIIRALAPSVKWIAHNGAGYDQIDVHECKAKGTNHALFPSASIQSCHPLRNLGLQYPGGGR